MQQSIGFSLFYVFGVVVGVVVALTDLFPSEFLLVVGLTHLLLLVIWGLLLLPRSLKQAAGERVQTAGYLHTLIGFAAALLSLERGDVELTAVLYPLGSALSTSIIGWLLGGEIASLGVSAERRLLDPEYQQVARELAEFSESLRQVHGVYLSTLDRATDAYQRMHVQQITLLQQHQQMHAKLLGDSEQACNRLAETQGQLGDRLNALFAQSIVRLGELSTTFERANHQLQNAEATGSKDSARTAASTRVQGESARSGTTDNPVTEESVSGTEGESRDRTHWANNPEK
ncbi:MAG: hypothetical protein AAFY11_00445 [Cyanobacteria bacterium J06641_5]